MKLPMIIAAASLSLMPAMAAAQDQSDQVGGAPLEGGVAQAPTPLGEGIPTELIVGAVVAGAVGIGLGIGLGGGGDGGGGTGTTSTTSTTSTTTTTSTTSTTGTN
ncbi:MAG: hypothetical protein AAF557_12185 [Pseudomonadota bacterium]